MKRLTVAFASAGFQRLWTLELPDGATVREALEAARATQGGEDERIPWDSASLAIFGEACGRGDIARDGDRIEICRPLLNDPKERRRQQARRR